MASLFLHCESQFVNRQDVACSLSTENLCVWHLANFGDSEFAYNFTDVEFVMGLRPAPTPHPHPPEGFDVLVNLPMQITYFKHS